MKDIISTVICKLFFPTPWSFSRYLDFLYVTPIPRGNKFDQTDIYRSITFFLLYQHLLKNLIKVKLCDYIDWKDNVSESKFDFTGGGRNTTNVVLEFLYHCYSSLENNSFIIAFFFRRHSILLTTLFFYQNWNTLAYTEQP